MSRIFKYLLGAGFLAATLLTVKPVTANDGVSEYEEYKTDELQGTSGVRCSVSYGSTTCWKTLPNGDINYCAGRRTGQNQGMRCGTLKK